MVRGSKDGPPAKRARRSLFVPKPIRYRSDAVYAFKRTFHSTVFTPTTATTSGFWQYFSAQFGDLPDTSSYTNLFDQYRIKAIKWSFRPRFDNFAGNDSAAARGGTNVHTIADPASTLVPTGVYNRNTLNQFLENGLTKSHNGNETVDVYVKPKIDNSISSGTTRINAPWISSNNVTVAHNGTHVFFQDTQFTGVFGNVYDVFVTMWFECRGQR